MARIRSIKPEFWTDEKLSPLPPITRLVFLGLVSQADDAGRLVDNVRLIDGLLFPETEDSSKDSLESLSRLGRILRYRSLSGQRLIQIVGWDRHQKVQNPSLYVLPAPPAEDVAVECDTIPNGEAMEDLCRLSVESQVPIPYPQSPISDPLSGSSGADAPPKPSAKKAKQLPADWQPNDDHRKLAATLLNVRLSVETQKFRDHFAANGKPMKDWDAAFRNWLRRAQEFAPTRPAPTTEAAAVREELPRSTAPRAGPDPIATRARQAAEEAERVDAWSKQHEGEAAALYADVQEELAGDVQWSRAPGAIMKAKVDTEYRRRVLDKLRPVAA